LTGMGGIGGAQELAELLRQMGRGPDSMLAHITPEEAQMLLEAGGSGRMNPMTGLPEFQPVYDDFTGQFYDDSGVAMQDVQDFYPSATPEPIDFRAQVRASEPDTGYYGTTQTGYNQALEAQQAGLPLTQRQQYDLPMSGDIGFQYTGQMPEIAPFAQAQLQSPAETMRLQEYAQGLRRPQEVQPGVLDQLTSGIGDRLRGLESGYGEFRKEYPMLERLLSTGAASLPAILQARRARREGSRAAEELRRLGQPLREQGEALRQQALSGGLTPQQARQQEARRAQLRQSAAGRGATTGTQEAMIENSLARERAGLAEVNLNNAIKQLNLANAYDEAAIRAKLQSDAAAGDLLARIMGNLVRSTSGQQIEGQGNQTQQGNTQTQPVLTDQPVTPRPGAGAR
jgi:hypothetical protein